MTGKFGKKSKSEKKSDPCTCCADENVEALKENASDSTEDLQTSCDSQIAELNEQIMRQRAEFENFRNRSLREKEEFRNFALEKIMVELLEVRDNFERALESAKKADDVNSIIEGVEMVFKQFTSILEKEGLTMVDCEGKEFDPHFHEAMMHVQTTEHADQHIVDVCKAGYELNSKVIRHAMVTVAQNPDEE